MTISGDRHRVIEGAFSTIQPMTRSVDIFAFDTPSVDEDATVDEYANWLWTQFEVIESWRARDAVLILLPTDRKSHPWSKSATTAFVAQRFEWQLFRHFVWLKQDADFHRAQYAFQDVWVFRKGDRASVSSSPIRYKDVVKLLMPRDVDSHVGALPSDILELFIALFAREGDVVMDPFAGRGSTMVAAHTLGLRSISIELHPERANYLRQMSAALEGTE